MAELVDAHVWGACDFIMWVQVPFLAPAGMAELVDALDSGSSEGSFMKVQVLLPAPNSRNPNLMPIGDGFGFLFVFDDFTAWPYNIE